MADTKQEDLKTALAKQPPYKPPERTYSRALLDALIGFKPQNDKQLPVAIMGVRG